MSEVVLTRVSKHYGNVAAVRDFSFTVEQGEFVALLGPSGCGKTTTLRMIAGFIPVTSGRITIGAKDITHVPPHRRNTGMVFQGYALFPHMTVAQNVAFGLEMRKVPKAEAASRVEEALRPGRLEGYGERYPRQLSGGQQQRVALARALVVQPEVFLLDEPLSNLDALLREKVRAELKQLFSSQKAPVVYVTHDQTEAMTLSTKVAVLNSGNVQQLDPPHLIYTRPANQFVAGFVGSPQMNLLVLKCQGNFAVLGDFRVRLPDMPTVPPEIVLGIRPERVGFADVEAGNMSAPEAIKGEVYLVENLGMQNLVSVRVKGLESVTVRALLPNDRHWNSEIVELVFPPQLLHWFDVKTGDRLQ